MSNKRRDAHLFGPGPKRILALDGGGIRGAVTIGMLAAIEEKLRARQPAHLRDSFVLSDYFDLIAGTSTGAIIASWLALGNTVQSLRNLYVDLGPAVFQNARFLGQILASKFNHLAFEQILKERFYETTLDSAQLRTGLLITCKRIDKGSAWIVGNNPKAPYWRFDRSRLLRDLVRASTAAPSYFEPVTIHIGEGEDGLFLDGAMGGYNNPSLIAFLYATAAEYGLNWETGAEQLSMLSLGTGFRRPAVDIAKFRKLITAKQAVETLQAMIHETQMTAVTTMQALSNPTQPFQISGEVGGLEKSLLGGRAMLHYERFDPPLDGATLSRDFRLDFKKSELKRLEAMDDSSAGNIGCLLSIGEVQGTRIRDDALPEAFDLADAPARTGSPAPYAFAHV